MEKTIVIFATVNRWKTLFFKEVSEANLVKGSSLGRLFELSVDKQLGSAGFMKTFMKSENAKDWDR